VFNRIGIMRNVARTVCLAAIVLVAACGGTPSAPGTVIHPPPIRTDQPFLLVASPLACTPEGGTRANVPVKEGTGMARLVFGMNQSLDGYVDHLAFSPSPAVFRHFIQEAQKQAGSVYGRHMYEVMRYWDDDHPEWNAEEHAFAAAWRNQPKWVVSRSLKSVGPNAALVEDDLEGAIRQLKAERDGEIEIAGPDLAQSLTELGLIDEYRMYLHPVVLGHGKPYFGGRRPRLRLTAHDRIGEDVIRLAYVPA
jgi:dihydrofolate reductase